MQSARSKRKNIPPKTAPTTIPAISLLVRLLWGGLGADGDVEEVGEAVDFETMVEVDVVENEEEDDVGVEKVLVFTEVTLAGLLGELEEVSTVVVLETRLDTEFEDCAIRRQIAPPNCCVFMASSVEQEDTTQVNATDLIASFAEPQIQAQSVCPQPAAVTAGERQFKAQLGI